MLLKRLALLIAVMAAVFGMVGAASAQEPEPDQPDDSTVTQDEVNEVAEGLYCPVCENIPLDVCGTQACSDWRNEIRSMLENGATEAEIRDNFAERYGRRVLATPDPTSFDAWLWVLPVVGTVIATGVLVVGLRRIAPEALLATADARAHADYGDLDPEYVSRVEAELEKYDT